MQYVVKTDLTINLSFLSGVLHDFLICQRTIFLNINNSIQLIDNRRSAKFQKNMPILNSATLFYSGGHYSVACSGLAAFRCDGVRALRHLIIPAMIHKSTLLLTLGVSLLIIPTLIYALSSNSVPLSQLQLHSIITVVLVYTGTFFILMGLFFLNKEENKKIEELNASIHELEQLFTKRASQQDLFHKEMLSQLLKTYFYLCLNTTHKRT
jgi:hypothetical protein